MGLLGWFRRASIDGEKARSLMERGAFHEAAACLRDASNPEHLALLAECCFQTGQAGTALALARRAMPLADAGLCVALLGTVYEACRHLGDAAGAAAACDELARHDPRYRRQAELVRRGEPLLRVVADVGGTRHEIEEVLEGVAGPVRLLFERNRMTLRSVADAVREGEELACSGSFDPDNDMRNVRAAAALDPHDPAPRYLLGMVSAHRGEWGPAIGWLEETERLAPGWFHARSALDVIEAREVNLFRAWHALAEGPLSPVQKGGLAEKALRSWPTCGHIHHLHGKALRALNQAVAAEHAFRRGLEHASERSVITRLCVDLGAICRSPEEKVRLIRRAVELGADLPATATARIVLAFS